MNTASLKGRRVIVTGAASGIGRAITVELLARDCRVLAIDIEAKNSSDPNVGADDNYIEVSGDVTNPDDWVRVVDRAMNDLGGVDVLLNNAGIAGPIADVSRYGVDDFDRVIAVNVRGVFLGMKAVTPLMKAQKSGVIINTSSVAGETGSGDVFGYAASKHAVNGMTRSAAISLAKYGILVLAVSPAQTDTAMMTNIEQTLDAEQTHRVRDRLLDDIPLRRYGDPKDIAKLCAFLISDDAAFMTGSIIPIDGGYLAK